MKYKPKFLKEVERFDELANHRTPPTDAGLKQFFEYESYGKMPDDPDPYFMALLNGKKWWEWTLNFYAERFHCGDWPGWYILAFDFKDDPAGFKQLRQRLRFPPLSPQEVIDEADKQLEDKMLELTDANFTQEVLDHPDLVLVDFWSPSCYPCNMLLPILETLAGMRPDVKFGKLNVAENQKMSEAYGIYAVPTLLFFKGGKVIKKMLGFHAEQKINDTIEATQAAIRDGKI